MKKLKTNLKLVLALGIVLIAMCLFNMSTVNATEVTEEQVQKMIDVIPDKIVLDIPELEYKKSEALIKQKVKEIWAKNNLSINGIDIYYRGSTLFSFKDFYTGEVSLYGENSDGISVSLKKKFSIVYSNSSKRNSADEKAVKNIKIKSPKYYEVNIDIYNYGNDIMIFDNKFLDVQWKYYTNLINDNSIIVKVYNGAGGGLKFSLESAETCTISLFKNGILYDVRRINNATAIPVINVPSTMTESKINNYIINVMTKYNKEFGKSIKSIIKGAKSHGINIKNGYTVKSNMQPDIPIIVKRVPEKISKKSIKLSYTKKEYTGKAIKPKVTIKDGSKTLKLNKDYTVSYKNNKKIGKATITIKGKGNYTGTVTKTFNIIPKKQKISVKTSSKKIKVNLKKDKTVTGYIIEYSTDKNFKKSKTKKVTIKNYKTTSKTIKNLKKGKKYYVRVRSYKTIKNIKYYSPYSKVVKIKVK